MAQARREEEQGDDEAEDGEVAPAGPVFDRWCPA